ncbi:hypothetical protein PFTANZ_03631, partial [Plasmodium falciparum Tanzania (2000708)]
MAPKIKRTSYYELTARDFLENIGREIKSKRKNYSIHSDKLKGTLSRARFLDGLSRYINTIRYHNGNSCNLDHLFHTNIPIEAARNPCYGRQGKRFDEVQKFECGNDKIIGNSDKYGSCAPPRRRHMCDQNLEFLNNDNTETTHDLLGNVLVTAKYEGDIIVSNHPNRGSSDVCTALARSFADIGDIVRGRDMFKPNPQDKVQEGLKVVFMKINKGLNTSGINDYDGDGPEYYKLREAWWTANRDQVWKVLTCTAGEKDTYFVQLDDSEKLFSNNKCGHSNEGAPLTNLDYVPQFLRWFDEWSEEFCRKKKDKLKKVKEVCRNYANNLYCSFNGYDCTKIIWKEHNFSNDSKCTKCHNECLRYENWIKDQKLKFEKQRDKYEIEKNRYNSRQISSKNNFNNIYYKEFYDELRVNYGSIEKFLNLLNKGNKCKNISDEEGKIDFDKGVDNTFSRSKYCQVCPYCGVDCNGTTCNPKTEKYPDCGKNEKYDPPTDVTPTDINVLYSGDEHGDIAKRLSTFCRDSNKENEKNYQEWKCYYNGESDNKCQMQKVLENKVQTKITTFDFFFDLWIKNLLRDTINWKSELKNCINNKNTEKCNKDCNENCKCFEKWVNQKEKEWNNMKELFKNKKGTSQNYYNKLNNHFQGYFFQVTNEVNKDEAKWNQFTEELRKKMDFSKANTGTNDSQDAIKVLLEHLKEDGKTCTANNPDSACNKPQADRIITPATTRNPCVSGGNASVGKITSVRRVAKRMQKQASVRHDGDISKLKADAKLGEYSKRNVERTLNTECDITLEHSNRDPKRSDGPCAGKNQGRFNIGENWKTGGTVSSKDHVFLPPRREHMCTSNLEYLQTNISPLNGSDGSVKGRSKINDSFLGDVLLSAKSEADFIKKKYKRQKASNGFMDEATICRAMKYSFADIGDIIRGRDLWERN